MKFATRSTMRNWITSSRKATTATGAAVYVEVDDVQGMVALTMRSAGVSTSPGSSRPRLPPSRLRTSR